jgi:hypothetical protein
MLRCIQLLRLEHVSNSLQGYNRPTRAAAAQNYSHLLLQPRAAALGCCSRNNLKMPHKS